jgi:hypothetical protein
VDRINQFTRDPWRSSSPLRAGLGFRYTHGFEHPDWYNGFEHDPEEAARVRVRLLRELAANRESLVATHLSFPSVCHVAVDGDVFRWVPGPWEY